MKMNTPVIAHMGVDVAIHGVVVGKASMGISEPYIIKCTDNQLPNRVYQYDTFICQLKNVEVIGD